MLSFRLLCTMSFQRSERESSLHGTESALLSFGRTRYHDPGWFSPEVMLSRLPNKNVQSHHMTFLVDKNSQKEGL